MLSVRKLGALLYLCAVEIAKSQMTVACTALHITCDIFQFQCLKFVRCISYGVLHSINISQVLKPAETQL